MFRAILLTFAFSALTTFAQSEPLDTSKWEMSIYDGDTSYFRKPSAGDIARKAGDIELAIKSYKLDLASDPLDMEMTYNLACAYALQRNRYTVDSTMHYLNIATASDSSVVSLTDPDFYYLLEFPNWKEYVNKMIDKVEAKYGKYDDIELSEELWEMSLKDQAFYYHLEVAGYQSMLGTALWELKHKINTENLERLEEIIAENGWPKSSVVGGNAASAVFLIIQHADLVTQQKYLPLMKEAADAGEAEWGSLALLIDRINLGEGKQQIYGSQIGVDENGGYYVDNLFEPQYVNQRRAEVGLGTIQEYAANWGIEWTIDQKVK